MNKTNKKVCPKCAMMKSRDDFKPRPDGSISYCYKCEIEYYREYNAKRYTSPEAREMELVRGRENYNKSVKPNRLLKKKKLINMMGGKCSRCGYAKSAAALEFHHKNPVDKIRTISHLLAINQEWAWEEVLKEVQKCEVLCANCHRETTYPEWNMDTPMINEEIEIKHKRKQWTGRGCGGTTGKPKRS